MISGFGAKKPLRTKGIPQKELSPDIQCLAQAVGFPLRKKANKITYFVGDSFLTGRNQTISFSFAFLVLLSLPSVIPAALVGAYQSLVLVPALAD